MFVTLMTREGCHTISLPEARNGKYWLRAVYVSSRDPLLSVEAIDGEWCILSGRMAAVLDEHNDAIDKCVLRELCFYKIDLRSLGQEAYLFTEPKSPESLCYSKFLLTEPEMDLKIGKGEECSIRYDNIMVSTAHAVLSYRNGRFLIRDLDSTNGTFVNNRRITEQTLSIGDTIYIMGMKIIIGNGLIAVNNPNSLVFLDGKLLDLYQPEQTAPSDLMPRKAEVFTRSPQFKTKAIPCAISVDLPPSKQNLDETPVILSIGTSLTMGLASMTTALFTVNNAISNGNIAAAVPAIVMSTSMLTGSILWPLLTRRHHRKKKSELEEKRLTLYRSYIDDLAAELDHALFQQAKAFNLNYISLSECFRRIVECDRQLWERSLNDDELLKLRLGTGEMSMLGEIRLPPERISLIDDPLIDEMRRLLAKPRILPDVPITMSLSEQNIVGITGDAKDRYQMISSLIMQIATLYGYDYVKIAVFLSGEEDSEELSFIRSLPHMWDDHHKIRFIGENDNEIKEISIALEHEFDARQPDNHGRVNLQPPYYVLVTLDPKLCLSVGILKKVLESPIQHGFSLLVAADEMRFLPKECERVICVNDGKGSVLERENLQEQSASFRLETAEIYDIQDVCGILAGIHLETGGAVASMPNKVEFLDMFGVEKAEHLNVIDRWKNNDPTLTLEAPIGKNGYGNLFMLDLHQNIHGPHGLVAGMTGSGKSEFIITYILSMAVNYHPNEVAFVLIDYKGGGMAKTFETLPHTVGIITNLDGAGVQRSLVSIKSELDRRQEMFLRVSAQIGESNIDIYKYQKLYRNGIAPEPMPHLFIISDEFAELKQQRPEFMEQLISIARIGRSLGVHLILATQKPAGVVNEQIWSNSKFKVCLKVQTKEDSSSMLNRPDAASLVQTGRFYLQVGYNELFELGQSAWAGAPYIEEGDAPLQNVQHVSVIDNIGRVIATRELHAGGAKEKPKYRKQVDVITAYLSEIAAKEGVRVPKLWKDPIPEHIFYSELAEKYAYRAQKRVLEPLIGELDDPKNQRQLRLTLPISEQGNVIVFGNVGSGKALLLSTLLYDLITNHTSEELHLYIMDFDAETMTAFSDAPQVGGVVLIDEEDKIDKLFHMLSQQILERKKRYLEWGGDFDAYNRKAETPDPAIVLAINNLTAFEEAYEPKLNTLIRIARNGTKLGVYTVVTRLGAFGLRYKLLSCFPQKLVLQCSDDSEYANIFGRTEGMVPSAYEGRGLVKGESGLMEFQTARFTDVPNPMDMIQQTCRRLKAENTMAPAVPIPILPDRITTELLIESAVIAKDDLRVPIGLYERNVKPCYLDLAQRFISLVASASGAHYGLAQSMLAILTGYKQCDVMLFDTGYAFSAFKENCQYAASAADAGALVVKLFDITVERNNEYKTCVENGNDPPNYPPLVIVIDSLSELNSRLSDDGKDKLKNILQFGQKEYHMSVVLLERATSLNEYNITDWYRKHITERDAVWIGGNLKRQLRLQCSNVTKDAIPDDFAFVITNGRADLIKLPVQNEEE